jgi:hypothetical protein
MVLFVAPGGFFVLPLLAWWLDKRRLKQNTQNTDRAESTTREIDNSATFSRPTRRKREGPDDFSL